MTKEVWIGRARLISEDIMRNAEKDGARVTRKRIEAAIRKAYQAGRDDLDEESSSDYFIHFPE